MYIANDAANKSEIFIRKNTFQFIYFGVPIVGLVNFLVYKTYSHDRTGQIFCFLVILPFSIMYALFFVYSMLKSIKRMNNTIKYFGIEGDQVIIDTFPILWLKAKEYSVPVSSVKFRKIVYSGNGKTLKDGYSLKVNVNEEVFLVKQYFDEYDEIAALLKIS